jgi:hypothetical protein
MRMFLGIVLTAGWLAVGGYATAQAADDCNEQSATTASVATGPTWHQGRWWYRHAGANDWLVWNGSQWVTGDSSMAAAAPRSNAARSFSYQPGSDMGGVGYYYGNGNRFGNVQIDGSYGQRPAAAKARANY